MPPYCPQCGVDNPANARFCDQCGAALIPVAAAPTPPSPAAPTLSSPTAPIQPSSAAPAVPASSSSVMCPQCGASAIPGEAFCDNCGAPLNAPARPPAAPAPTYSAGVPPQPTYPAPQPASITPPPAPAYTPPAPAYTPPAPAYTPPAPAYTPPQPAYTPPAPRVTLAPSRLTVASSGATIALPAAAQAVIGRADPVSNFYPDIDLNPHGALEGGVGRRHARLSVQAGQLMIEDLDSTNGTVVNGQKLAARQSRPLSDGDQILIGKLLLRFQQ
ncbi:MAG: zinc ribbon domain-containing protein [Kouleothrix sp.]|nr:zinc ribbon domain-containing protein [Kouleothrix sp.]